MIKNYDVICISSIDWDFIWQQHQTIMTTFAKNNNRVLFIENTGVRAPTITDTTRLKKRIINWFRGVKGFRKELNNLYIYSPLILPFPYSRLARWINKYLLFRALSRWMKIMEFNNPIIFTFLPTPIVLDIIAEIPHKAFFYYCTDNFSATSLAARKILKYESKVLKQADAVFVMARNMLSYCLKYNSNVTCIPMGVDINDFENIDNAVKKPKEIESFNGRIIGYIGSIRNSIDKSLVEFLVKRFSECTFVFVGPIQTDVSNLRSFKNVIFTGQKAHNELSSYIRNFDICVIPYKKDKYTDSVSPAKLNEYLIMGKPVVSTDLEEVLNFNKENGSLIYIARNKDEFANCIFSVFNQDNEVLKEKRIEVARNNSWEKKIQQISDVIEEALDKKETAVINWQEKLSKVYRSLNRRFVKTLLIAVSIWLVVFYTPLIWFISAPLKISQLLEKADCIVVFAGGVGESGRAGQGFEERVKYATELFKESFARNLIFSSGYSYAFKEPIIMKALALSLGVPDDAIILEDGSRNTYENVKNTSYIIKERGWKRIILVSSPYHMRRAYLVFKKQVPFIQVICSPIPNSRFFSREHFDTKGHKSLKCIDLQQINALVHECLGIIYYWWRGYL